MPATIQRIAIDPTRPLAAQAETGHNRWHEDVAPVLVVDPGRTVVVETRDAFDGQLNPQSTAADVARLDLGPVHPLTGPIYVNGAAPGDLLEVKLLNIECDPWDAWGYTVEVPGFGFLRDLFPEPYIVHWNLYGDYAESPQLPGVRIHAAPFPGIAGLAPSAALREEIARREADLAARGGFVLLPDPTGAVPPSGPIAEQGLRTIPPRETGGNIDIKHLTPGVSMLLPVYVEGGLFSTGDVHFAQGDCEACGTAIEIRAALHLQFKVHKGEAARRGIRSPQFFRDDYFADPTLAVPRRFYATTGFSVTDGINESENLTMAARNALLAMIEYLGTRGYDPQQAYALCSVAVDLHVSQVVDVPNFIVSALLPLDIFI
ncbi:acetamidase/formamidase family protein [Sphaerobacter thermophilus]|uniref:acetamidase/formamidase family protein n=1 Tax=Sphaerobacter thermophilus TaxID=2057 RepID=UPI000DAFCA9E|nr:MAG: acetamidase [Sphaerobacter thermophilus]